jgi:hypothetical protein
MLNDIRYGYRTLIANPGFAAIAVLSLALGIGANTAIFSFLRTILMKDLPVREPEQLALFGKGQARGIWGGAPDGPMDLYSWNQYREFKARNAVFEDIITEHSISATAYMVSNGGIGAASEPANAILVSGNYFQTLGVSAEAGQLFDSSADEKPGANPQIVLSYGYWKRRYQADVAVIGRTVRIGSMLYGLSGFDAITIAASAATLGVATALAAFVPAQRAAGVDPMVALRYE